MVYVFIDKKYIGKFVAYSQKVQDFYSENKGETIYAYRTENINRWYLYIPGEIINRRTNKENIPGIYKLLLLLHKR